MATQISNVVTPAQAALNGKLYGGGANAFGQQTPAPQSSFDAGAAKLFGNIGGAINSGLSALGGVKFGQQPTSTGPFSVSPALQASANTAQNAPAAGNIATNTAPASGLIGSAPVGQTVADTGQQTNPNYVPGSIGPGNTPFLPTGGTSTAGTSGVPATGSTTGTTTQTPAPVPSTFSGLVGSLAGTGQNAINTGSSQEQQAYQEAQALQQQLAQSQGNEASTLANMQGNPIPIEFQQGRGNIVQGLYQSQQNALSSELAGESALASQGTALQGQGIGALGSATSAAQPNLGAIGSQQYYQPLNADQTSDSQYGTGPAAASNVASIQSQTSTINDLAASRSAANSIVSNQLTPFLQQNGINPSDFNEVNQFLQNIGAQTSSPQYSTFKNMVADLASVYAQILTPPGGSTTDLQTQIAQSLINSTSSGQSILQVIQNLDGQAQSKISGLQANVSNLQNGQNVNTSSSSTGGSSGGSIYDF